MRAIEADRATPQMALRRWNLRETETLVDLAEIGRKFLGGKYHTLLLDTLLHEGRRFQCTQD